MLNHMTPMFTFIFIIVILYSIINRNSDAATTLTQVFNILHEDIKAAVYEIWSCSITAIKHLSITIDMVKLIELIIIGLALVSVPEIVTFIFKAFSKIGKL